jgi:hypothetical protein
VLVYDPPRQGSAAMVMEGNCRRGYSGRLVGCARAFPR